MLTSAEARSRLPYFTLDQVHALTADIDEPVDDLTARALYLGYLCAGGNIERIKAFIRETEPEDLREILNCAPDLQWNGTSLHMLLSWNTGAEAHEIFDLLVQHGAEYVRDGYGFYPWQKLGSVWITPIEYVEIGERNEEEFQQTIETLRFMYHLDEYEGDQDQEQDYGDEMVFEFDQSMDTPASTPAAAMDVSL